MSKIPLVVLFATACGPKFGGLNAFNVELARALGVQFGRAFDLACVVLNAYDVGMTWTPGEQELGELRIRMIVTSRAAGREPPIDTVWIHLQEADALRESVLRSLRMGFQGRLCIHPDQVSVVNAIFTPSPEDAARAQKIVDAFQQAEASGLAAIQVDGVFVDYPIVYRAQRVLATLAAIRDQD